jgi:hypothetical protein
MRFKILVIKIMFLKCYCSHCTSCMRVICYNVDAHTALLDCKFTNFSDVICRYFDKIAANYVPDI